MDGWYCWWLKSQTTTWDVWNPINNGKNYQPQLVSRISAINSTSGDGQKLVWCKEDLPCISMCYLWWCYWNSQHCNRGNNSKTSLGPLLNMYCSNLYQQVTFVMLSHLKIYLLEFISKVNFGLRFLSTHPPKNIYQTSTIHLRQVYKGLQLMFYQNTVSIWVLPKIGVFPPKSSICS